MRKNLFILMFLVAAVGLLFAQATPDETTTTPFFLWLWPVALLVIGWLVGYYMKPWINAKPDRLQRANEIALIADRVTDELVLQYPNASWSDWIDKAVDRVIKTCGLTDADDAEALARREVASQIVKKRLPGVVK